MTPNPKEPKIKPTPTDDNSASGSQDEQDASGEENEDDYDIPLDDFDSVNSYLDSLNLALDTIEQRNDDLKAQLLNLLQSNREIRQAMQEENAKRPPGPSDGDAQPPQEAMEQN
ncbi:UPF0184 protein AAEL002161 [Uranotaenia lowii]|uniref:UPF0184 protein AAEL002161 n=1 Tax=Uranotaenia lowii TaxID=190385 RepID=UPI0024788970|nr:UPF0184 protein AAEL002161 [Uranotaenia lowii]